MNSANAAYLEMKRCQSLDLNIIKGLGMILIEKKKRL